MKEQMQSGSKGDGQKGPAKTTTAKTGAKGADVRKGNMHTNTGARPLQSGSKGG